MKIIDLHTDTLTRKKPEEFNIFDKNYMINYDAMIKGDYHSLALAVFLNLKNSKNNLFELTKKYFDATDKMIQENPSKFIWFDGKEHKEIQVIRSIEEGEAIEGSVEKLSYFAGRGLKLMTLTWNYQNSLAFPNNVKENKSEKSFGLTRIGEEVVQFMNDNNILLDTSHLGDKAFYDCLRFYHKPIIASHSNSRRITDVVRNLDDDMIKIIADSGGVIGINLCESFVYVKEYNYLDSLVLHIEHIRKIGGIDVLALGSDFDGIARPPVLEDCSKWNILFEKLKSRGFTDTDIEKLAYKNALRVLKTTC